MVIPNPDLDLWNFDPRIHFWVNLDSKTGSYSSCLKIGTHDISRMLILIPTLVSWISNPNFLLGQIWTKNVKVVFFLTENWHTWYLGSSDSKSRLDFWNSVPKIHFWANLGGKSQSCPVWLKIGTHSVSTMLILILTLFFSVLNPKSFFGQIWAAKLKVVYFDWQLAHMIYRGCWFLFRQ